MTGKATNIEGFDQVARKLNREIRKIKGRTTKGLLMAAIKIRKDMDNTPPIIPVDTGNLRSSWFTYPIRKNMYKGIVMGFRANYALKVHENVASTVNWKRPNSGPKFFEMAIARNYATIKYTIASYARIK